VFAAATAAAAAVAAAAAAAADPHKSRMRAMLETTYEGAVRMLEDPWLFIWHLHLLLTCMHFLIWISSYGWIGGKGPKSIQVWRLVCAVFIVLVSVRYRSQFNTCRKYTLSVNW
jgi:hypothetical protein